MKPFDMEKKECVISEALLIDSTIYQRIESKQYLPKIVKPHFPSRFLDICT